MRVRDLPSGETEWVLNRGELTMLLRCASVDPSRASLQVIALDHDAIRAAATDGPRLLIRTGTGSTSRKGVVTVPRDEVAKAERWLKGPRPRSSPNEVQIVVGECDGLTLAVSAAGETWSAAPGTVFPPIDQILMTFGGRECDLPRGIALNVSYIADLELPGPHRLTWRFEFGTEVDPVRISSRDDGGEWVCALMPVHPGSTACSTRKVVRPRGRSGPKRA